ncbi:MAG: hypothetical protein C5B60_09795 [Chloroflexi bacterium]|nr:MAG: hypothetical protein C5B60_09795 [Chloroflexota bacterium]
MSALFGALGSLAESYGLAQQRVQQNALEQIRQRLEEARQKTEERYADIAQERLAQEKSETGFRQQTFQEQKREFDLRQKQYENTRIDMGLPMWTTPDGRRWKRFYFPYTGKTEDVSVPGTGGMNREAFDRWLTSLPKEIQPQIKSFAETEVVRQHGDWDAAWDKIYPEGLKEADALTKATKKTATIKPETKAALAILQASLFGGQGQPGLKDTLGVLDDAAGRHMMQLAGVGQTPTGAGSGALAQLYHITVGVGQSALHARLSPEQQAYAMQFNRAISAIQGLRPILGNFRSTEATIQRLIAELPDPQNTSSRNEGLQKLALVEREIRTALASAGLDPQGNPITPTGETPATSVTPAAPSATSTPAPPPMSFDDFLNQKFGPAPGARQ